MQNNSKWRGRQTESHVLRRWSHEMSIPRPRNSSRSGFIIPLKITQSGARFLHGVQRRVYTRAFMQIVGFITARDGYAYESLSFAGGYTPLIAPHRRRRAVCLSVSSISRPLSSPFSHHLRRLLNFTPLSWRYRVIHVPLEKSQRRRRSKTPG